MTGPTRWRWWLVAATVALVGLGFRLDGYALLEPDEGRNAEIAREMAAANTYAVPRLNAVPYPDKPILFFAAVAATMEVLGPTEFAARLPPLLFTLATLALVWWFARRWFGVGAAWTATLATASTPLTLAFARTVIFDSALTLFVTTSIVGFVLAAEYPARPTHPDDRARTTWWTVAGWVALALGVLTKGPIALALPLLVTVPYLAWRRRLGALWDPVAVLAAVALVLPWLLVMSRAVPGFFSYVVLTETVARLTTDELHRSEPFWYFLPILFAGALPWSAVVLTGWGSRPPRDRQGGLDRRLVLLLLWIVVPLVFFSLSQSKRPQYMLPLMVPVGLLVGLLWSRRPHARLVGARVAGVAVAAIGVGLLALAPGLAGRLLDLDPAVADAIPGTAWRLGLVTVVGGVGAAVASRRRDLCTLSLVLPVASIPLVSAPLMDAIGETRSSRRLAAAIAPVLADDTEVVAIGVYPLSLPFYLRRPLTLASDDGTELTSNYIPRTYDRWADRPTLPLRPRRWGLEALATCTRPRVFVVAPDDVATRTHLEARLPLLGSTRKAVAYGPCGVVDLAARLSVR